VDTVYHVGDLMVLLLLALSITSSVLQDWALMAVVLGMHRTHPKHEQNLHLGFK